MPDLARKPGWRRTKIVRRGVPVVVALLIVAGGSVGAWAATGGSAGGYRTVPVGRADIEQTLSLNGTVSNVTEAAASFPVSGTLSSVSVALGDTVTAGQEIARIDTTDLQRAVVKAQAAVDTAQAALAAASATSTSTSSPSSTGSAAKTQGSGGSQPSGGRGAGGGNALDAPQRAVGMAQTALQRSTAAAAAAATAEQTACAGVSGSPTASPSASPSVTPTPTGTPSPTPSPSTGTSPTGCAAALTSWQQAQASVARDQQTLSTALSALVTAATQAASSATSAAATSATTATTAKTPAASSPAATGSGGSASARTGAGATGGSGTESAVLRAQADLVTAQSNLAGAVLTSPIAGIVATMPYSVGATESTSDSVTVVGTGAVRVTVEVPLATLPKVKVGQVARVTAAGATVPVAGTVESISMLPSAATSSTVTYPVVVLVPSPTAALASGATAGVSIVLATRSQVVAVPNSAVSSLGTTAVVSVLKGGTVTPTRVEVGAKGALFTEVTSGLAVGDEVVLANLSAALPASSGELTTRGFAGGAGGFPAGGFAGGGFAGGGFAGGAGVARPGG